MLYFTHTSSTPQLIGEIITFLGSCYYTCVYSRQSNIKKITLCSREFIKPSCSVLVKSAFWICFLYLCLVNEQLYKWFNPIGQTVSTTFFHMYFHAWKAPSSIEASFFFFKLCIVNAPRTPNNVYECGVACVLMMTVCKVHTLNDNFARTADVNILLNC